MIKSIHIPTLKEGKIKNKRVIVRVDFDISIRGHTIADDTRLQNTLPTLKMLLQNHNRLILISKLNRPVKRDKEHSLYLVAQRLQQYLPKYQIKLINDFLTENPETFHNQKPNDILLLENIRFYPEEKKNDPEFAKKLSLLGDVFVLDAFAMAHREEASVVGIPKFLPSFAGLLFEKEITAITHCLTEAKHPIITLIGGAKTSTKLPLLYKLTEIADYLILGGGIANTFLRYQGFNLGKSLIEDNQDDEIHKILLHAKKQNTRIILPRDFICASQETDNRGDVFPINHIPPDDKAVDIGPETQASMGVTIASARTIIWNGPFGYIENQAFSRGTDFLYYAIAANDHAYSLIGGGDTLAAIAKKEYLSKISHISTGGGAMLEFIEKGTLPGIEALQKK